MSTDVKDIVAGLDETKRAELLAALGGDAKPGLTAEDVAKMLADRDKAAEDKRLADDKVKADEKAEAEVKALREEQAKGRLPKSSGEDPESEDGEDGEDYSTKSVKRYARTLQGERRLDIKEIVHYGKDDIAGSKDAAFIEDFQAWNDDVYLMSRLLHTAGRPKDMREHPMYKGWWERKSVQRTLQKALYTSGSGNTGEDWIPAGWSQSWIDYVGTQGEILPTFPSIIIPQGSESITIPAGTRSSTMYLTGESTTDEAAKFTPTTPTSRKVTLTPKTFALRTIWSQEMVEDAINGTFDRIRQDLADSAALGIDEALIYGDASADGFDTGASYASNDRRKAFDGLRYRSHVTQAAGAEVSLSGMTWTMANSLMKPLAIMGKWAGNRPVMVIDKGVSKFLGLVRDTQGNLVNSPVTTPQQAASQSAPRTFLGTNFIESEALRTDLNASGIFDDTTETYTAILFYNPDGWQIGTKRGWTVEVEKDIETQQWVLVMTTRMAFAPVYVAATEYTVGYAYGILNPTSW